MVHFSTLYLIHLLQDLSCIIYECWIEGFEFTFQIIIISVVIWSIYIGWMVYETEHSILFLKLSSITNCSLEWFICLTNKIVYLLQL